ncbi:hypothetical protein ACQP2K_36940 [Microbispora siamensis]
MDLSQIEFWEGESTVTDRAGAGNGACAVHVMVYIRNRLRHGR